MGSSKIAVLKRADSPAFTLLGAGAPNTTARNMSQPGAETTGRSHSVSSQVSWIPKVPGPSRRTRFLARCGLRQPGKFSLMFLQLRGRRRPVA